MPEATKNNPVSNFKGKFTIRGTLSWLVGGGEFRPLFPVIAFLLFFLIISMLTPQSPEKLLTQPNPVGYETKQGYTVVDHLSEELHNPDLAVEDTDRKVKITVGMLAVATLSFLHKGESELK